MSSCSADGSTLFDWTPHISQPDLLEFELYQKKSALKDIFSAIILAAGWKTWRGVFDAQSVGEHCMDLLSLKAKHLENSFEILFLLDLLLNFTYS